MATVGVKGSILNLGRVHVDTSMTPVSRAWVMVNTSLHVFQYQPFTIIRVVHTCTSYIEMRAVLCTVPLFLTMKTAKKLLLA